MTPPAPLPPPRPAETQIAPTRAHVETFDGLRGLAIVLVVWFHIWQLSWLPNSVTLFGRPIALGFLAENGWVGVELFFLVSGFCLAYPHARHALEGRALPGLAAYASRRAWKILPSYWFAIAAIACLFPAELGPSAQVPGQLLSHLLFVHNGWHETKNGINGVFWSLAVEVQFYLIFPLLARAMRARPAPTFAAMMLVAYGFRCWVMAVHAGDDAFWLSQLPAYIDCFASGMAAAFATVWLRQRAANWPWLAAPMTAIALASVLGLGALLLDLDRGRYGADWPMAWTVGHRGYLAVAFAVLGVASQFALAPWRWLLANPLWVLLSGLSYNMYLWHQFLARQLLAHHLPAYATPDPHNDPVWQGQFTLAAWLGGLALAYALTRWLERPWLEHGWRAAVPRGLALPFGRLRPASEPEPPAA